MLFYRKIYSNIVKEANKFRASIDKFIEQYPELFLVEITPSYQLKDVRGPKKYISILIKKSNISYTIRPAFVMPYMTVTTYDIEKTLFLRKYQVPFHALTYVFGENAMKWLRMEQNIG